MPFQRHILQYTTWRVFPADGAGGPNLYAPTPAGAPLSRSPVRQFVYRASAERFELETKQRYADRGETIHPRPDYLTPGNFVRSSALGFEDSIYLALTQPLRELGA